MFPNLFKRRSKRAAKTSTVETREADIIESSWQRALIAASSSTGIRVNRQTAIGVSTLFACLDVLSRNVASLPLSVYKRKSDGKGRDLATDHPLFTLLHDAPNREMTSSDFRRAMQSSLSLHGRAFAQIIRTRATDEIIELYPLDINEVEVTRDHVTAALIYKVKGETLAASEVIHLKGATFNGISSLDIVETCRDVIGLAVALDRNAGSFFKNGSRPSGFLQHPETLTKEAANRLADSMTQDTGGDNAYKVKLLEEGMQFKEGRATNNESQFDESRDRQSKEVARLFGVPAHKVGLQGNQPRANVEQENLSFVTDTLRPILVNWEQALNQRLLSARERREYFIEFNLSALLRGDINSRFKAYATARQWGWLNVNEIREKENLNPIGAEGDVYLQPLNMSSADTIINDANESK